VLRQAIPVRQVLEDVQELRQQLLEALKVASKSSELGAALLEVQRQVEEATQAKQLSEKELAEAKVQVQPTRAPWYQEYSTETWISSWNSLIIRRNGVQVHQIWDYAVVECSKKIAAMQQKYQTEMAEMATQLAELKAQAAATSMVPQQVRTVCSSFIVAFFFFVFKTNSIFWDFCPLPTV
jgi:hypothetical protein